jgi:CheY-like chemotaxis protein
MTMENVDKKNIVLIVDDDNFMLDMYVVKLKERGFVVEANNDPIIALEKLRAGLNPTVILFDIIMPKMGGIEFIKIIREEKLAEGAILIAVTNQLEESYLEQAKAYKIDDYIIKANTIPSEVLNRVEEIIKNHNKT